MKNKLGLLNAVASAGLWIFASGCGVERFPSYSGIYSLDSAEAVNKRYDQAEVRTQKLADVLPYGVILPKELRVYHRPFEGNLTTSTLPKYIMHLAVLSNDPLQPGFFFNGAPIDTYDSYTSPSPFRPYQGLLRDPDDASSTSPYNSRVLPITKINYSWTDPDAPIGHGVTNSGMPYEYPTCVYTISAYVTIKVSPDPELLIYPASSADGYKGVYEPRCFSECSSTRQVYSERWGHSQQITVTFTASKSVVKYPRPICDEPKDSSIKVVASYSRTQIIDGPDLRESNDRSLEPEIKKYLKGDPEAFLQNVFDVSTKAEDYLPLLR